MSETDSENDYESADDERVDQEKSDVTIFPLKTATRDVSADENQTKPDIVVQATARDVSADENQTKPDIVVQATARDVCADENQTKPSEDVQAATRDVSADENQTKPSEDVQAATRDVSADEKQTKPSEVVSRDVSADENQTKPSEDVQAATRDICADENQIQPNVDVQAARKAVPTNKNQTNPSEDVLAATRDVCAVENQTIADKAEVVQTETEEHSISKEIIKESALGHEPTEIQPPSTQIIPHKASESDKSNKSSISETQKGNNIIVTQPKRVQLRLEKKQLERNTKTTPPESTQPEKPEVPQSSSWGFGSWGSSLMSSAAMFTSQVSQGIGTVLETVESTLGAPPPEDLATILKERRESEAQTSNFKEESSTENEDDAETEEDDIPGSISNSIFTGVSSLTKALENTGSKVIMGGLDTLEMIGKKTIDILTEGDPGLRQKRSAFAKGTTTLSQMLREAKLKADSEENNSIDDIEDSVCYSKLFDDFQGLVHLEALEMLSGQCDSKVQGVLIMGEEEFAGKMDLENIKNICDKVLTSEDVSDDQEQDFETALSEYLQLLTLPQKLEKIISAWKEIDIWLKNCVRDQDKGEAKAAKELYQKSILSLAEFTAKTVEQFHKYGELILLREPGFDAISSATNLTGLTIVVCTEVGLIANRFCECLNTAADDSEDPDAVTPLITSVYLEASNSATYIQDAFQLLVPVLQSTLL